MGNGLHDLDGVHLHSIPPVCAVLEQHGRIPILNTDEPITPKDLLNVAYYAVESILPPYSIEHLVRDLPVSTFARPRCRAVIATKGYYYGDVSDPLLRVAWTRERQHAWLEAPDDDRSGTIRLWKTEYSFGEYYVNKEYISDYRALGLLPPVPGHPGRALCWKGVLAKDGRYRGVMGAPYRVGQSFVHPGAMACCGPFGAIEYSTQHLIAIAADIRAVTDPDKSRRGVIYAETGVPIAMYRVAAYDWRDGTVDLVLIESSVPYNPLDLL